MRAHCTALCACEDRRNANVTPGADSVAELLDRQVEPARDFFAVRALHCKCDGPGFAGADLAPFDAHNRNHFDRGRRQEHFVRRKKILDGEAFGQVGMQGLIDVPSGDGGEAVSRCGKR